MRISLNPAAASFAIAALACTSPVSTGEGGFARTPGTSQSEQNSLAFGPAARPFGVSMSTWNSRWWRWELGVPAATNPGLDPTGAFCDQEQPASQVWYLASVFAPGSVTRNCTVPHERALLVSLSSILNDYPCPDPNFRPAPGQSLEEFLTIGARQFEDAVNALNLSVDGHPIVSLFRYRFTTPIFNFTGDPSLTSAIDPCITGTEQPGVSDGYFVMLKPLAPGMHTLQYGAADTRGFQSAITYQLTVE